MNEEIFQLSETAGKINFLLCKNKDLSKDTEFVLQTTYPQCLFQILKFDSHDNFCDYLDQNRETIALVHEQYQIVLRFSGNLLHVPISQPTAAAVFYKIQTIKIQAAEWLRDYWGLTENKDFDVYKLRS